MTVKVGEWGITVLVGVETALYFIRLEVARNLSLPAGAQLPVSRYIIGTSLLE